MPVSRDHDAAPPALAASSTRSSDGSSLTTRTLSTGRTTVACRATRATASSTITGSQPNFSVSTRPNSNKSVGDVTKSTRPSIAPRTTRSGGPPGNTNAEMRMFVSATTLIRGRRG